MVLKVYLCFVPVPQVAEHGVQSPLMRHSPGQSSVLHCLVSILFLLHTLPLSSNCIEQVSFRVDTPLPHDFEQEVHGVYVISFT